MSDEPDIEKVAEMASVFMQGEYGQYLMMKLTQLHYGKHEQAELPDLSTEKKAFLIERAAGIREVIDFITSPVQLKESGTLDQMKRDAAEQDEPM